MVHFIDEPLYVDILKEMLQMLTLIIESLNDVKLICS